MLLVFPDFSLHLSGIMLGVRAVPKPETPEWREGPATAIEVVALHDLQHGIAGKNKDLQAVGADCRLHGVPSGQGLPGAGLFRDFVSGWVAVHFRGALAGVLAVAYEIVNL